MIIDHTHPTYKAKRKTSGWDRYNGAYYYSKEIVKYIIPNVKTDRNWITVNIPSLTDDLNHSIVFIHNNRNPNYYNWLRRFNDLILVCGVPSTVPNMRFFGTSVYLPLSIDVKNVKRYKKKEKLKDSAFAGRRSKLNNYVPKSVDILTDMRQGELLKAMSNYENIYAVGRTAIQAKALSCNIKVYDQRYPDPNFWKVVDSLDAAKMLQEIIDKIDNPI